MKIALIGYGKMGHMIERIALSRGHEIVAVVDPIERRGRIEDAEVAIEFSTPATAEANVRMCFEKQLPVVCGTTGWDSKPLQDTEHAFIWTSNYSLGVNILFAMNRKLAQIMSRYPEYTPSITEVHHIHKLDKPSGTAKTLAEALPKGTAIESVREGEVPGIHTIEWDSEVDTLTLSHSAKSREGFALGAVLAAEWLPGKKGFHTMQEVLGL